MNFSTKMAVLTVFLILAATCYSQEKPDTTLTVSIPAVVEKIKQLNENLDQTEKNIQAGQVYIEQQKENKIILQSTIRTLQAVLQDTTILVRGKK